MIKHGKTILAIALLASAAPLLQGCFPAVATGVTVGVLAAFDRRTLGTQTDDETIEWKAGNRLDKYGKDAHINVTSYNRKLLITGEALNEDVKNQIGDLARTIENVQDVWNEMRIGSPATLGNRSNDAYITSKVKARFVDSGKFAPQHVKVVTEGATVFLLGIVNEREAQAAIQVARTTDGVRKVVNVMEVVAETETRRLDSLTSTQKKSAPAASSAPPSEAPVETRSR